MGTRSDLRGFLKQQRSQKKTSEISSPRSRSYTNSNAQTNDIPQSRKECTTDEVVKYMSKLPAYLQGDEESNHVFNVGVLDWSRLQQWKKLAPPKDGESQRKVSSSTTTLGTLPNASASASHHRCDDDQVHACSNLLSKVQHSSLHGGVRCTLDPELPSSSRRNSLNKQEIATCYKSSAARDQEIRVKNPGKSRRSPSYHHLREQQQQQLASSGLLSDMGNSGGSLGAKGNLVVENKDTDEMRAGEVVHALEEEKFVGDSNHHHHHHHHQVSSNIVLLRSRKQSRSTTLSLSSESSLDDNPKVAREVNPQVPRSSEDIMKLPLLGAHLSAKIEPCRGTRMHSKTASSRIFDQEKKRDHSPSNKRFSFSFGRLSRSFTFKDDSSSDTQPLTSSFDTVNKSNSMRFDSSAHPEEKHCASRVIPLRRLLDHPLLKSKRSENVLPSEARSSSSFNQDEKKQQQEDASRTRALLQLTIRNGIPLFQFVVDDDDDNLKSRSRSRRSILGATMKSSASSVKDDSVQYCTFYSVNEVVKKKRSWLIKDKQQQQNRFVYNVIGEMRLSSSSMNSDNISSVMREAVLVDESEQVVKGRKEVAAVVIKQKPAGGTTTVIVPGGVHSIPEKGAPTPLISRWRSGGCCDCGGWDVECKLHILSNKTLEDQSFKLYDQQQEKESDKKSGPVLAMTELKTGGIYRVEFGSFLSHLQAFFVCVTTVITTCASESEEETVSKTTAAKSSSPFAPPLSPVGRA